MSTEDNKAIARRIFEEVGSQGNFAVIDKAISPNFVYRTSAFPEFHGPGGSRNFLPSTAKPSLTFTTPLRTWSLKETRWWPAGQQAVHTKAI